MTNAEILGNLLQPADTEKQSAWEVFLKTVDATILWYPSAENDLSDLNYRFPDLYDEPAAPSAFIHTGCLPTMEVCQWLNGQDSFFFENTCAELLDQTELRPRNWDYASKIQYPFLNRVAAAYLANKYQHEETLGIIRKKQPIRKPDTSKLTGFLLPQNHKDIFKTIGNDIRTGYIGKIYLLKIRIADVIQNILFAFIDDLVFQQVFIAEGGLRPSTIYSRQKAPELEV